MSELPAAPPQVPLDRLRLAISIYLENAYSGCEIPEPVLQRVSTVEAAHDSALLLAGRPFERSNATSEGGAAILALRLGNRHYPHMKLQLQAWPNHEGYLLSVNTHDQVLALNPTSRDSEGFRKLQADNQRTKEQIEQAWDLQGLPTFQRYLRDYLESQKGQPPPEAPRPA